MATHDPITHETTARSATRRREQRKVVAGTIIGTSIEWYDFFLLASAAGLVFNHLFFEPIDPQAATLMAFATVGLSFLFRPSGHSSHGPSFPYSRAPGRTMGLELLPRTQIVYDP